MSIQLVARARRAGLIIRARSVFQHQTVAALAGVSRGAAEAVAPADIAVGDFPATPIMHWLLQCGGPFYENLTTEKIDVLLERLRKQNEGSSYLKDNKVDIES